MAERLPREGPHESLPPEPDHPPRDKSIGWLALSTGRRRLGFPFNVSVYPEGLTTPVSPTMQIMTDRCGTRGTLEKICMPGYSTPHVIKVDLEADHQLLDC